ncbi:cyclin-dependent protein kinase inhibitor [Cryptococcus deuterogattii R265]|uniref:cyclin-dependent protein kinase inhibitor n=1 Tax=Cryptococcus deuterogattii (strain R265) TaxID=294750 RepID=UPI0019371835|nr:cyclin-dependent protein kinase inhibitor [Cryptococcus deuterogattii R265]
MKFGKTIQSQQVPGWGEYYLNYKALKKIINSYAAGRPASDASLLSLGLRPARLPVAITDTNTTSPLPNFHHHPSSSDTDTDAEHVNIQDLEPLPPQTAPPGNTSTGLMGRNPTENTGRSESFKAHRDVFFFTLQRELEKINAFYLIKERDLRLRLLSLLSNRKRLLRNSSSTAPDVSDDLSPTGARRDAEWASLEEGWRLFERDLGKLQGFIEINAIGFRKILKKWDKRSKSNTKELYLERQVEVQPCFNREFIAKLSDIVAANLLDLENGSEHISTAFLERDPSSLGGVNFASTDGMTGGVGVGSNRSVDFDPDSTRALALDALADLEANLGKAISAGHDALIDWVKVAHARQQRQRFSQSTTDPSLMRILWQCALHTPPTLLPFVLSSLDLDYDCIDNINGRSILHKACIVGSLALVERCVEHSPELVEKKDVYERRPLHYAAMHGFADIVSFLLQTSSNPPTTDHRAPAEPSPTDMDGYTPLMHAIQRGHLAVVQIFVSDEVTGGDRERITLEPTAMSNDLIPLSLACEHGHVEVARLLLQRGARVIPNSEGLYPQHFAAKAGHSAICQLLVEEGGEEGGGKDRKDKYNLWTPLHHAAIGGEDRHLECVKVLVEKGGCDVNVPDEYGKSAGWYAAWFGHVECLNYLRDHGARLGGARGGDVGVTGVGAAEAQVGGRGADGGDTDEEMEVDEMGGLGLAADPQMGALSPGSDLELEPPAEDFELIPSLSLPPPIIPLRVYGHEFLAKRCLIQLSLGHRIISSFPPCNSNTPTDTHPHAPAIKLYSRSGSGQDSLHLWSSLKLVMTSKSDISAVPHSVILPLADEREVFSFHAQDLDRFTLELSLYPTFGSKVIGRAVLLPGTWRDIKYHKQLQAPLLDHNLKAIGEVALEVSCITPFGGAQLEIGGRVETYWKSKVVKGDSAQDHAHLAPHKPLSVFSSSGAVAGAMGTAAAGAAGHGIDLDAGNETDVVVSSGADTGMSTAPVAERQAVVAVGNQRW